MRRWMQGLRSSGCRKASRRVGDTDQPATMLAQLKAELLQKGTLYSERILYSVLKRQIESHGEGGTAPANADSATSASLERLWPNKNPCRKIWTRRRRKLAAARLGESLEKDQHQRSLRSSNSPLFRKSQSAEPSESGWSGCFAGSHGGGGPRLGGRAGRQGIRRSSDIFGVADSQLVVSIPYITTHQKHVDANAASFWLFWFASLF